MGVWARGRQRTWASFCTRHSWLPLAPKGGIQDACEAGVTGSNNRVQVVPVDVDCVWIEELEGNDSEKDLHAVLATVDKVAVEEVVVVW